MLIVLAVVLAIVLWQQDFLANLYIRNQITGVGWVVNGAILTLFLLGQAQIVRLFLMYDREENALISLPALWVRKILKKRCEVCLLIQSLDSAITQ